MDKLIFIFFILCISGCDAENDHTPTPGKSYSLEDYAGEVHRSGGNNWRFTPFDKWNSTDWKQKRVEVREKYPEEYDNGDNVEYNLKFMILDDQVFKDHDKTGIHQIWSEGNPFPKYYTYIYYDDGLKLKVRYTRLDSEGGHSFEHSEPIDINLSEWYAISVNINVDNAEMYREGSGSLNVMIDEREVLNKVGFTHDAGHITMEKFGLYCEEKIADVYNESIAFKIKREWLD